MTRWEKLNTQCKQLCMIYVFVEPFILHTHCGIEKQANKLITKPYCISALGYALRNTSTSENTAFWGWKKNCYFFEEFWWYLFKNVREKCFEFSFVDTIAHPNIAQIIYVVQGLCLLQYCTHNILSMLRFFLLHLMSFFLLFTLSLSLSCQIHLQ